jgi:hypothetical protein
MGKIPNRKEVKAKSFRKKMQVSSLTLNRQKEDLRIREE